MSNNSTPLIRLVIALAILVEKSSERQQPAPVYHAALLRAMRKSGLTVQQRPLLVVRTNGRLVSDHTPDFIVQDKSETAVVCVIASLQTKPADVERAQACLDAYREKASGLLINFCGEKLLWSLLIHLYLHQVQAEPT